LHDDLQIIHTDLKIENIMLIDSGHTSLSLDESCPSSFTLLPKSLGIRLIDFGSAVTTSASKPSLVSTRHYRAPEIVLGVPYTYAIDMWSIGCILYELFTGRLLFDTHEDGEHLKMMERVVGSFPVELSHGSFFKTDGSLVWDAKTASKESRDRVQKCSPISANLIDPDFCDLVTRLLCIDASKRLTAAAALQHAWLL
jgi:dual-specificity kinase